MATYKIIRNYLRDYPKRVVKRGLTLEEAQAHCRHPESASDTCMSAAGKARTRRMGPWFDGYDVDRSRRRGR